MSSNPIFAGGFFCDYEHVRQAGLGAVLLDEAGQTFEAFVALSGGHMVEQAGKW